VSAPGIDISSTGVRERVRQGQSCRYLVADPVALYIATHRLYHDDAGQNEKEGKPEETPR
jgi:nicotinate-nucleotide adenylyltransferase